MKAIKTILILLTFLFISSGIAKGQNRQFKCGQTNCTGLCGRFTDQDGDGFCDLGIVSIQKADTVKKAKIDTVQPIKKQKSGINKVTSIPDKPLAETSTDSINHINDNDTLSVSNKTTANTKEQKSYPYDLLLITTITMCLYFLTFGLYKRNIIRRQIHRRIWNSLLLISFLGSGIIGLILVIQINYHIWLGIYRDFLYWHVQLGIAMAIISIFHIFWHLSYFKRLFNKLPKTDSEC